MCVGVLEVGWLLVESVMGSLLFKFSGCANRGLMAQKRSPLQPRRSEPGKSENWGKPSGGTDFLIARTGGDFNVPIRKAVGVAGNFLTEIPKYALKTSRPNEKTSHQFVQTFSSGNQESLDFGDTGSRILGKIVLPDAE